MQSNIQQYYPSFYTFYDSWSRGCTSLVPHLIGSPSHWSPISLVPHLIDPPISTHAPLISLAPHLIGLWGAHHWSPISLVPHLIDPHLIAPPSHWSPISLVPQLAPMHHPFNWSPISLVPPTHWSPNVTLVIKFSLVLHLIGPPV